MKSSTSQTQMPPVGESGHVWNSPLPRAIGFLRRTGQHFCADQCQELFDLLHDWSPSRLETTIVKEMIAAASENSSTTQSQTTETTLSPVDPDQMCLEL